MKAKKLLCTLITIILINVLSFGSLSGIVSAKAMTRTDSLIGSTDSSEIILNSITCNKTTPVQPNTELIYTIDATGTNLTYTYEMYYNAKVVKTLSTKDNTFSYIPKDTGLYYIAVKVEDATGKFVQAVSDSIDVEKPYIPLKIQSFKASTTYDYTNKTIKFNVSATGDKLKYVYEVYKDSTKIYTSKQTTSNAFSYSFNSAGNYKVKCIITDSKTTESIFSPIVKIVNRKPVKPPTPSVESLVKPSVVYATLKKSVSMVNSPSSQSKILTLSKGVKVEILSDKDGKWYRVRDTKSGKIGWVAGSYLSIPKDPPTNKKRLSKAQLEEYVNKKGFNSNTKHFIWVDIDRQLTNVFVGSKGSFKLLKSISCSTGTNKNPTTRGTFTVRGRGSWFSAPSNPKVGAKYFVQFNGSYLFHSTLYSSSNKNKSVDSRVGVRLSHGCIRLPINEAKWIYDNIKSGTKVFVN
ncbi:MAG: L,D-transpeptidase family protein [Clostridium sp.]|uniref:L,D-transpeptidase family protein n=1 Tax=Clostridium sp. TaxID=1506 RepID=UPI002FC7B271